jgi:SAM-dependent methyltransferase
MDMGLDVLVEHRSVWKAKPVLADIYGVWFEALLGTLGSSHRRVLELGAGPGFLSEYARGRRPDLSWIATDILATPWNDLAADGLRLPFRSAAFDAILGVDFLHHLARPRRFFEEAARVLTPGGRVALAEPWVTPLSYPIYRCLHREGCSLGLDSWQPFDEHGAKDPMDGDAAVVWGLARRTSESQWRRLGFRPPRCTPLNAFAYLASLGFLRWSLLPRRLAPLLLRLDAGAARSVRTPDSRPPRITCVKRSGNSSTTTTSGWSAPTARAATSTTT